MRLSRITSVISIVFMAFLAAVPVGAAPSDCPDLGSYVTNTEIELDGTWFSRPDSRIDGEPRTSKPGPFTVRADVAPEVERVELWYTSDSLGLGNEVVDIPVESPVIEGQIPQLDIPGHGQYQVEFYLQAFDATGAMIETDDIPGVEGSCEPSSASDPYSFWIDAPFDNRIQADVTFDYLRGEGFTPGNSVHVTLWDPDYGYVVDDDFEVHDADGDGQFFIEGPDLDVRPGQTFTAQEIQEPYRYRELEILPVRFETFDPATHEVSGIAPIRPFEDGEIRLHLFDQDDEPITDDVFIGEPIKVYPAGPAWTADVDDFYTRTEPLTGLTAATVEIPDVPDDWGNGDTVSDGSFADLPAFEVFPDRDEIRSDWFDGYDTITISSSQGWEETLSLEGRGEFHGSFGPVDPGDTIVIAGEGNWDDGLGPFFIEKTLVVHPLAVDDFAAGEGEAFISGTAEPGARVVIEIGTPDGGFQAAVFADETSGSWSHTFIEDPITEETNFRVWVMDEDIDRTTVDELPRGPHFVVVSTEDRVVAFGWPNPDTLSVTIDGAGPFTDYFVGEEGEIVFEPGIDLVGGQYVVMRDTETGYSKDHWVRYLAVTGIDGSVLSGRAAPGVFVGIFNESESGSAFRGLSTPDPVGDPPWDPVDFSVDFSVWPPPEGVEGDGQLAEIVLGFVGMSSPDYDGDETFTFVGAPWLELGLPEEPVAVGTTVSLDAVLHHAPPGTTALIDWHDGSSPDEAPVNESDVYARTPFGSSHDYLEPGVYPVSVDVFDSDSALVAEGYYEFVVVYDPDGGFVTGGGWIDSPEGAYPADPALAGEATFGFVAKYKKGASVPSGNTQFVFHAGDLNFHSTAYDWLVVTGSDYARFKGAGTINGENSPTGDPYRFQIWAGDGTGADGADTFRIKIFYEIEEGEVVVYDNGMHQELGGGSIVVHTSKK